MLGIKFWVQNFFFFLLALAHLLLGKKQTVLFTFFPPCGTYLYSLAAFKIFSSALGFQQFEYRYLDCCLGAGPDNPHCTLSCLLLRSFSINIKYAALLQLVLDRALLSGEHIFQVFKPPRQRWFSFTWGSATITLLENHF